MDQEAKHDAPWQLSPKLAVDAQLLVRNDSDQVGQLFLALALAVNDLKGLVLFERYLLAVGRPGPDDWAEDAAQWRGLAVQIHRWAAGVLHEVMVLLLKHKTVLRSTEIKSLVATLSVEGAAKWTELTEAALTTNGKVHSLLLRVRNTAAFHYDSKSLRVGFKKQFLQDAAARPTAANQSPQYSAGPDLDATRFYYADAAAQQVMFAAGLLFGAPETDRALVELATGFNQAVAPLVAAFIRVRVASSEGEVHRGP